MQQAIIVVLCLVATATAQLAIGAIDNQKFKNDILQNHNALRKKDGGSGMPALTWSDSLATYAAQWANGCQFTFGQPAASKSYWGKLGQNLYASCTSWDPNALGEYYSNIWYSGKKDFSLSSYTCKQATFCPYYLQMISAKVKYIGCALKKCPKKFIGVCYYSPKVYSGYPFL